MRTLLHIVGIGLIALAVSAAAVPMLEPSEAAAGDWAPPALPRMQFAPFPATAPDAGPSLLGRSPFASDRSAFDRSASMAPHPPPVEVRLTGISRMGGSLRASLLIGGQSLSVKKGDDTPVGKVLKVEPSAVVLEGPPERRIEMFRQ